MAATRQFSAILSALRKAVTRDLAASFNANNLLFLGLLGRSAEALFILLGLLLLFPLSSDPLSKIPASRLALWPLSAERRMALRIASLAFSPIAWIGALILLKTRRPGLALTFCGLAAAMQGALALGRLIVKRDRHWDLLRALPEVRGRLGGMYRKDLRQTLSLLDPYAALLLSLGATAYRIFARHPDAAALPIMSLLVGLAMSTCAQSLFGLDLDSGITRYRLLPVRGWEILLAKGAAFLSVLFVLLLPLDPLAGLTFGLAALAVGNSASVIAELAQRPWRFASGNLALGAFQVAVSVAVGFFEHQYGVAVLALTAMGYGASVYQNGKRWERMYS